TGFVEDVTNTDTVAINDTYGFSQQNGAATGVVRGVKGATFKAALPQTDQVAFFGGVLTAITASATPNFIFFIGTSAAVAPTESTRTMRHGYRGRLTNMRMRLQGSTVTGTVVVNLRKNGANANQSLSFTGAVSGDFEDLNNRDFFEPDD